MNKTIEIMKNHRCIRSFLDKEITNAIIDELVAVAQDARSGLKT